MNYRVAVRALCEFTAKQGDLDLRFTPAPSAQEGIAGHMLVAGRRGPKYQSELALSGEFKQLQIRGRADGYDPELNQLEEYKTFRGDFNRIPANHRQLHWAQVKIYGWLLCQKLGLTNINLALVYFDIVKQKEILLNESYAAESLKVYFEVQCEIFLRWAEQELAHRSLRNKNLATLKFPHESFHAGQRQLAEAVYKAASLGRCLMAQAPTGIGKTIGTLFPLLKALPRQQVDKVFYLAAKTSGRRMALDSLALIKRSDANVRVRVLELVAREKTCEHPNKACHGESCPLAKGFYDRLPVARQMALDVEFLDQSSLRSVALKNQVCPYYLSQELARWCDVIVGDYNYYFDLNAMLYALTVANQWQVSILVDEAHNMLERARKMYTAELDQKQLQAVKNIAPKLLRKLFQQVDIYWDELNSAQSSSYKTYSAVPSKFIKLLQKAVVAITDYVATQSVDHLQILDSQVQKFYFDAMHFVRIAELFGDHFLFDVTLPDCLDFGHLPTSVLCLRNVIPSAFLKQRFAATNSAVLFSATLSPHQFYGDTLGLPSGTAWIDVQSPFHADQLSVHLVNDVSTRYRHRASSLTPIVDLIADQCKRQPGNYLAFFSSFDYMQQVAALFSERNPANTVWMQERHMDEFEREIFLQRFTVTSQGIGFAVLGGVFAEGIDLPGRRLIGAFIATLGLPQMNPVNEAIKERMALLFDAGYDYTYLYPGLQKVVQAAGRVIRTTLDQGVVYLIDDRYAQPSVRALLPSWWSIRIRSQAVKGFSAKSGFTG